MRSLALLLAVPLVLAGCLAPTDAPSPSSGDAAREGAPAALLQAVAGLSCEAEVGEGTSDNLLVLGHLPNPEGATSGEADIRGDLALVSRNALGGFHVVDVSNPLNMTLVSTWTDDGRRALDVKWTATGDGAVVGDFGQIRLVDLTDPADPVLRGTFQYNKSTPALSGQAHMVQPYLIGGEEYVFVATQTNNQALHVLKRDGWNLTYVASTGLPLPIVRSTPLGNHDPYLMDDPMLGGKPTMYVSEGLAGWSVWDVSDPAKPKQIGGTLNLDPYQGYVHTVRVGFWEGKRIVFTMEEVGHNALKAYDATDLEKPILLAAWTADKTKPNHPNHNIQLVKDHLYLAHYSQGVYIFNVSDMAQSLPLLGEFRPIAHLAAPGPAQEAPPLWFTGVWDVLVDDGIVYVNDRLAGLYSVGFACIMPGDPTETSFG